MANSTSKSTKAKTKTTKKPAAAHAAKVAKKSAKAVNKTVKKTVEKANAAKTAAAVTTKTVQTEAKLRRRLARVLTPGGLRKWHLFSAVIYVALAAVASLVMGDTTYQIMRGHLTSDVLASQTSTVFAPAQHVITNMQIRWLVVGVLAVSALFSLVRYYYAARERRALDVRISPWRWFDFAVTGALMTEVVALLSGMQDIVALKLLGTLVAVSAVFAWIAERENAPNNGQRVVRGSFVASFVTGAVVLMAVNAYAVATVVYGMIRSPWYVYALYIVGLVAVLLVAVNQLRSYRRVGNWANYLFVERNYLALSLLTKVAFAVILIVGLR